MNIADLLGLALERTHRVRLGAGEEAWRQATTRRVGAPFRMQNSAVEAVRFEADRRRACGSYRIGEAEGAIPLVSEQGRILFAQKSRASLWASQ